jgi:regulator of RNase E activity RraA
MLLETIISLNLGSSEIADALGKTGSLEVQPINSGKKVCGECYYIPAFDNTNWNVHEKIKSIPEKAVAVIVGINTDRAIIGDLICEYLFEFKKVTAVVVIGKIRDIQTIKNHTWPVWCRGFSPVGAFNKKTLPSEDSTCQSIVWEKMLEDTIVICDETGVVVIKKDFPIEDVIAISEKEKFWHEQLRWGKSTFEIVCE